MPLRNACRIRWGRRNSMEKEESSATLSFFRPDSGRFAFSRVLTTKDTWRIPACEAVKWRASCMALRQSLAPKAAVRSARKASLAFGLEVIAKDSSLGHRNARIQNLIGIQQNRFQRSQTPFSPVTRFFQNRHELADIALSRILRFEQARVGRHRSSAGINALDREGLLRERRKRHSGFQQLFDRMKEGHGGDVSAKKQNLAGKLEQSTIGCLATAWSRRLVMILDEFGAFATPPRGRMRRMHASRDAGRPAKELGEQAHLRWRPANVEDLALFDVLDGAASERQRRHQNSSTEAHRTLQRDDDVRRLAQESGKLIE